MGSIAETQSWEYQTVEIIYTADCGGNGGYVIERVNGLNVCDDINSKEADHFSEHLSKLNRQGWEVVAVSGGPRVNLEYEYRKVILRRAPEKPQQQWVYMDIQVQTKANGWYTHAINDRRVKQPKLWTVVLQQLQAQGWMIALEPYLLVNTQGLVEIILKHSVAVEGCQHAE